MDSGGQTALKRRKHNIMQFKHVYKPKKQSIAVFRIIKNIMKT